jgi:hypothetical protein
MLSSSCSTSSSLLGGSSRWAGQQQGGVAVYAGRLADRQGGQVGRRRDPPIDLPAHPSPPTMWSACTLESWGKSRHGPGTPGPSSCSPAGAHRSAPAPEPSPCVGNKQSAEQAWAAGKAGGVGAAAAGGSAVAASAVQV